MPAAAHDRPHPTRTLLILGIAALAYALAQTTLIPALGTLAEDLHVDSSEVAWVLTAYLVSAAVCTPLLGRLGDMYGKRRMLIVALLAFAAGSVVSALGTSLEVIVAGRVLQGVGGGIFPLCFGLVRDEFPREKVSMSIGLISATAGIGGGAGLVLGGLIIDNASYHLIFWVGVLLAGLAAISTTLFIPESPIRRAGKLDVRGALVLSVGLVVPLLGISQANSWGWTDPRTLGCVAIGLVVLVGWVFLERRTEHPLADMHSLAKPPVLMTNITTLLVGFSMFSSFILIPQIAQAPTSSGWGFGVDATTAGLLMLPGALAMLFMGPLSGALGARVGNKVPLALGSLLSAVGLLLLSIDHSTQLAVIVYNLVLSCGIGFAFSAMPNLIVEAVPQEQTGEATGFNALVRSIGSSLGSQVAAAVLAGTVITATGLPTDRAFDVAFLVGAGGAAIATVLALLVPISGGHRTHLPIGEEIGAASPLGEPAYGGES